MAIFYWSFLVLAATLFFISSSKNNTLLTMGQFVKIRATVMIAYVSKLLIAIGLLLVGLVGGLLTIYEYFSGQIIHHNTNEWLMRLAILLGLGLFVALVYGMLRNGYRYKIFREKLKVANLPKALQGLKIVQISDIHAGSLTEIAAIEKGIELINKEAADLVCFTGDLVNNVAEEMTGLIDVFKKIQARYGVYSILGNHDYGDYVRWPDQATKMLNFKRMIETHRSLGWELLMNEHKVVAIKDSEVAVIGVENYSAHPRFPKYGDLAKASQGLGSTDLKILLSHDPTHWDHEVNTDYPDINLTLSGHTHGGQFGIELGRFNWSPIKYFYKRWVGLYQEGKQFLYVNRGFGFLGYPGRVGILPEITVITIQD